jgi:FAD/FMN-containing dehydrogenase
VLSRRRFLQGLAAAALLPAEAQAAGLPATQLRALRAAVRGRVVAPGDAGYDAARVVFNRRWDGIRPPAVVQVRDFRDVRATVAWANRFGVALVARSGGHGYNGNSTSRRAVVVDLGRLSHVAVHADGTAAIGPGARLGQVYAALAAHGVGIPAGSCPTVGLGGLVLGGGVGLAGRAMGLTLDRVRSLDVVTADGALRRVDATHDDDLFWALRGGGGSFAIVTTVRLRVSAVGHAAWFRATFPRASRAEALAAWDALAPHAPRALTALCTLSSGGAAVFGQYLGPEATLRRLVAPLAAIPGAALRTGTDTWLNLQRRWAGPPAQRQAFAASSLYVQNRLSAHARAAFVAAADEGPALILDPYGGAIAAVAPGATAFAHRGARFSVQVIETAPIPLASSRVARARRRIAPFGHGAYPNYADPDLAHPLQAYYGSHLAKLRAVKHAHDPANRFRPAQEIS